MRDRPGPRRRVLLQLFAQEKVLPPTPRRLREARRRGEVARSQDLLAALSLLVVGGAAAALVPAAAAALGRTATRFWSRPPAGDWTVADAARILREAAVGGIGAAAPLALLAWGVILVAGAAQTGLVFTAVPLAPRLDRLDPVAGLRRLWSRRALVELLKALIKVAVMGGVLARGVLAAREALLASVGAPAAAVLLEAAGWARRLLLWGAEAYLAVAVLDYAYQRWEHQQALRMSLQEWKQDHRETEGDPLLKQRLRQRQRQLARQRMLHEVPRADVVVTNPTRYAVALRYDPATMAAPVVVAKGRGTLATRIRALAEEHGVPIMEEPPLARALYQAVEVGQEIPEELYAAVAEVLAFVWRLRGYAVPAAGPQPAPAAGPEAARARGPQAAPVAGPHAVRARGSQPAPVADPRGTPVAGPRVTPGPGPRDVGGDGAWQGR
ncbi:MAG TPA: EscU/YscU/HrcU family type III secretion system export apparatus switch protein [Thermaerobacter sp.]